MIRIALVLYAYLWLVSSCPSYLGYTVPFEWKSIVNNPTLTKYTFPTTSHIEIDLPFAFDYFGKSFAVVSVSSNGWLSFGTTAVNPGAAEVSGTGVPDGQPIGTSQFGDAILLYEVKMGQAFPKSLWVAIEGTGNKRTWILELNRFQPFGGFTTYDKCSDELYAQIRLSEEDGSIGIYILSGFLKSSALYSINHWFGIQSATSKQGISTLPFFNFTTNMAYFNPTKIGNLTISPNYFWSRLECPFPVAYRFECKQCQKDSDCSYPGSQNWCGVDSPTCSTTADINGKKWCVQPYSKSGIPGASSVAHEPLPWSPKNGNYTCPQYAEANCCPFGPPTWVPSSVGNCSDAMTLECLNAINDHLCQYCSPNPYGFVSFDKTASDPGTRILYVPREIKDMIDAVCGTNHTNPDTYECNSEIWVAYPDLPIQYDARNVPPQANCSVCNPAGIDSCDSGPNVTYNALLNGPVKCNCKKGASGETCYIDVDECIEESIDCINGGVCVHEPFTGNWECLCDNKYTGQRCEYIDLCRSSNNQCGKGGDCVTNTNNGTFTCHCYSGYLGDLCQYNCTSCIYGDCITDPNSSNVQCDCALGYRGPRCDEVDPCVPNPCANGVCTEEDGIQMCNKCFKGYEGPGCKLVNPCYYEHNPCVNGRCIDNSGIAKCECSPGWNGTLCDNDIDDCENNPCDDGTCIDILNGYVCTCADGITGYTSCEGISGSEESQKISLLLILCTLLIHLLTLFL